MAAQTSSPESLALRLQVLRELANSLRQAQTAVLASDLDGLQLQTARQQALVEAMGSLANDVIKNTGKLDGSLAIERTREWVRGNSARVYPLHPQPSDPAWRELLQEGARVWHLNQVLGALLRRGRRSMEILALLHASCAATYTRPKPPYSSAARRWEE